MCKLNENMSNVWDVCCSQQERYMIELCYVYKIE